MTNETSTFSLEDKSSKPYAWMLEGVNLDDITDVEEYVTEYAKNSINATNYSELSDADIYAEWEQSGELEAAVEYITERITEERTEGDTSDYSSGWHDHDRGEIAASAQWDEERLVWIVGLETRTPDKLYFDVDGWDFEIKSRSEAVKKADEILQDWLTFEE